MPKESVEWEKCGYCKKVQKNRGGNTGYNCRKHTKKVTITKVRLYTEEQLSQAIASAVEAREQQIEEAYKKGYSDRDKQPICAIIPTEKQNIDFAVEAREREIKSDLLKVADEIEGEELRSEVERYFKTIE